MGENKEILDFGLNFNIDLPDEEDDQFKTISKNEYVVEWEAEITRYMHVAGELPINKILYEHIKIPKDLEKAQFIKWVKEEIRRCKEGHNGLCGKMYFFFNYCYIQGNKRKSLPNFRVIANEWFKFIEACQKSNGWGIICVKRRRVGASWMEAADMVHDCIFNTNFNIGMNSKSDVDSQLLFLKIKFIYENLPNFLRIPCASNTKNYLDFSYFKNDEHGTPQRKGNLSTIIAKAPTDNAYEGMLLGKWISDESGKIKNLATIWQYTEDCLMENTRRVGIPILFGTAGDISSEGRDLEYMWRNADSYRLKRFFFAGWMGLTADLDPYGNDNKEEGIRWIVYERHRRENLRTSELNTFIQKYPLTVPEAFTVTTDSGVGNIIKIKAQQQSLIENPAKKSIGYFKFNNEGGVNFVPDPKEKCTIYEHPKREIESLYIGGCDPADHNETFDEVSDLSMYIMKRQEGTDPPRIVFEYTDRPNDLTDYYEQALMACIYYNKAKILIENNRYGMINYFEKSAYKFLMARTPKNLTRVVGGKSMTYGSRTTMYSKKYGKELIAKYIEDYYEFIPSWDLLDECVYFGARNTDKVMAFMQVLLLLEDYNYPVTQSTKIDIKIPHFGYKRVNGQIKRILYEANPFKDMNPRKIGLPQNKAR